MLLSPLQEPLSGDRDIRKAGVGILLPLSNVKHNNSSSSLHEIYVKTPEKSFATPCGYVDEVWTLPLFDFPVLFCTTYKNGIYCEYTTSPLPTATEQNNGVNIKNGKKTEWHSGTKASRDVRGRQ